MKTKITASLSILFALLLFAQQGKAQIMTQKLIHFWDFNNTLPAAGAGGDSLGTLISYTATATAAADKSYPLDPIYTVNNISSTIFPHILFVRASSKTAGKNGIMDNGSSGSNVFELSNINYNFFNTSDTGAVAKGNEYVRARNPDTASMVYLYAPTNGFQNVNFYFSISASSYKGPNYNVFTYSTDGGSTWDTITGTPVPGFTDKTRWTRWTHDTLVVDSAGPALNPNPTAIDSSLWGGVNINFSRKPAVNNNPNFIIRWQLLGLQSVANGTSGNDRYDNFSVWGDTMTSSVVAWFNNRYNVTCYNAANGSARVHGIGGTPPYTYSWGVISGSGSVSPANGSTTDSAWGLAPGVYSCIITDAGSISAEAYVTILAVATSSVTASLKSSSNVNCYGNSTGASAVTASGGTGTFTYSWNSAPAQTTSAATALPQGSYTCTIKDGYGCVATVTTNITQPAAALTETVTPTPITCLSQGSATTSVGGGTMPYNYTWTPTGFAGSGTANYSGLSAQVYTCTITDANTCTVVATTTVTSSAPAITFSITPVTCNGLNNGAVATTVNGGATPYTFLWSNGNTATSLSNLIAGNYSLTVTDNNSCQANNVAVVPQPNVLKDTVLPVPNGIQVIHYWDFNSTLPVAGAGGISLGTALNPIIPEYSVLLGANPGIYYSRAQGDSILDNGSQGAAVNDLHIAGNDTSGKAADNLFIRSRNDDAGAAIIFDIPTTGYQNVVLDWALSASSVKGAQVNVFGYSTDGGNTWNKLTAAMDTFNFGGVATPDSMEAINPITSASGWYPVHVNLSSDPTTNNNPNLQFRIKFSGSNTSIKPASGNERYDNFSVKGNQIPRVNCYGASTGEGQVVVTGGTAPFTYNWSSGETSDTAMSLPVGTSSVTVQDINGCIAATATINIVNPPLLKDTTSINNGCYNANNGVVTSVPTGGTSPFTYLWSTGATSKSISKLSPGAYTVTVTDENGCTYSTIGTVVNPTALVVVPTPTNVVCYGNSTGDAQVGASGGTSPYTYKWSDGNTTSALSNIMAGNYSYTVTDNDACTSKSTVAITQPTGALRDSIANQTTAIACYGATNGTITVGVKYGTGTYSYTWTGTSSTSATASNLAAGTYTVAVNDANLCGPLTSTVTITQPAGALRDSIANQTTAFACYGATNGTITVGVKYGTGPYTYTWTGTSSTSATASNLAAGTYTVAVNDVNLCGPLTSTVTITQPSQLRDSIVSGASKFLCYGGTTGTITVGVKDGTGPYTYTWTGTSSTGATASNLAAGTYTVSVNDANLCGPLISTVTLNQPTQLRDSIIKANVFEGCIGLDNGAAGVSVKGGTPNYTYSWSSNPVQTTDSAVGLGVGNYTVTVTDVNNCVTTAKVTINPNNIPNVTLGLASDSLICDTTKAVDLSSMASPAGGVFKGNGMTGNIFKAASVGDGKYSITYVFASNGCSDSAIQNIRVYNCLLTGVTQLEEENKVTVFPNPNIGLFTVSGLVKGERIELYNELGMLLRTASVTDETMQLDITEFADGVYLARIVSESNITVLKKIIKTE